MREASDEKYGMSPQSLRVVAVTGTGAQVEALAIADHPDASAPGFDDFVRYVRADESDLHGFVPEQWQSDAETKQKVLELRIHQVMLDLDRLDSILNAGACDTRERLQRVRAFTGQMRETWEGRNAVFGEKPLADGEDMV